MNRTEALLLIEKITDAFPATRFDARNVEAYVRDMLDLDAERAERGVAKLIRQSKFLPTIADIRESARSNGRTVAEAMKDFGESR